MNGTDAGKRFDALPPWRTPPARCVSCDLAPTSRIERTGEFVCDDHRDRRLNGLTDRYGAAGAIGARQSWGQWFCSWYWRPHYMIKYKRCPPFLVTRLEWHRMTSDQRQQAMKVSHELMHWPEGDGDDE